ncbi:MAG: heparinase II/III family protein [Clostridia bacterium]|nr:heparinase II/III family protein [Clostridia bacterium]
MSILNKSYNRNIWQEYRTNPDFKETLEYLDKCYETYCIGEIPATKFSEFRLFKDVGDRTTYQKTFFIRQHRLFTCMFLSLIYPEREDYFTLLQDTIFEICDQYVWALPAHMPSIEVNNNAELDLDATTMSMALALIKYMLGDRLHPLIKARIDAEIDRRLVKPLLSQRWHWEFRANNWTTVCAGASGCALMLTRPDIFELVKDRLNRCMKEYVDGYKNDGVCVEGAGYWSYGFGYYMEYADMLYDYTNGREDLLHSEKLCNIATFLQKLFLDENVVVSYGDAGMGISMSLGYMYKLKTIYGDIVEFPPRSNFVHDIHYLPFMLNEFLCYDKSFVNVKLSKEATYFMEDEGWFVQRKPAYGFGARGGWNGDSHNHNDVGSFIFSKNDRQVLCDIGLRPYTRQYFEHEIRYTFLEASSRGHNCPIINGEYQKNIPGERSVTTYKDGVFTVDFANIYGIDALKKLTRTCKIGDTSVEITDEFIIEGEGSFTERLIAIVKPEIGDGIITVDGVTISFDKEKATADYIVDVHTIEVDVNGNTTKGTDVYCININVNDIRDGKFRFTVEA